SSACWLSAAAWAKAVNGPFTSRPARNGASSDTVMCWSDSCSCTMPYTTMPTTMASTPTTIETQPTVRGMRDTAVLLVAVGNNLRAARRHGSARAGAGLLRFGEVDVLGGDGAAAATGHRLPLPVEVGVGDHLLGGRSAVLAEVLGGVGVADERGVVAAH